MMNAADAQQQQQQQEAQERARRQQVIRMALLVCFVLIFLNGDANNYQQSAVSSSSPPPSPPTFPVSYRKNLNNAVERTLNEKTSFPRNISGYFMGGWNRFFATGHTWNRTESSFVETKRYATIKLETVSLPDVPHLDFVYGYIDLRRVLPRSTVVETYLQYTVQGVFLANTGEITLLSTSSATSTLYLQLPSTLVDGSDTAAGSQNGSSLTSNGSSNDRLLLLHPDIIPAARSLSIQQQQEQQQQQQKQQEGGRESVQHRMAAGIQPNTPIATGVRTFKISHSAKVGTTGLKIHMVDMVTTPTTATPVKATELDTMRRRQQQQQEPWAVAVERDIFAIGDAFLPFGFRAFQQKVDEMVRHNTSTIQRCHITARLFEPSLDSKPSSRAPSVSYSNTPVPLDEHGGEIFSTQPLVVSSSASSSGRHRRTRETAAATASSSSVPTSDPLTSITSVLYGSLSSSDCGEAASFNISGFSNRPLSLELERKGSTYSLIMSTIAFAQIALILVQLRFSQTHAAAAKISILCICCQSLLDAGIAIGHLLLAAVLQKELFGYFAWISCMKLLLFGVVEMRTVFSVYSARFSSEISSEGYDGLRRRLATVHLRFYAALFFALLVVTYCRRQPLILFFLFYSFWVPQIIHNIMVGCRRALHPIYYVGTTCTRLFLPLYIYGCPMNFLNPFHTLLVANWNALNGVVVLPSQSSSGLVPFSPRACVVLVLWQLVQIGILALQDYLGPRYCIPASFFPRGYDYYRPVPAHVRNPDREARESVRDVDGDGAESWSAGSGGDRGRVMTTLTNRSNNGSGDASPSAAAAAIAAGATSADIEAGNMRECIICYNAIEIVGSGVPRQCSYMLTPCDHLYHKACLRQWLTVKLECPACRGPLPPLDEDDE